MVIRQVRDLLQVFNAHLVRPVERSLAKVDSQALQIPLRTLFCRMGPNEDTISSRELDSHHKPRVLVLD